MPASQHCLDDSAAGWTRDVQGSSLESLRSSPNRRSTLKLNFTLVEPELVDAGDGFGFGLKLGFVCESLVDGSLFAVAAAFSLSTGSL